jgi:hypothetical protein
MGRGLLAAIVGLASACAADPPQLPEGSSTMAATSTGSTSGAVDTTSRGMDAGTTAAPAGTTSDPVDGSTSDGSSSDGSSEGTGSTGGGFDDPACFPEGPYGTCTANRGCDCFEYFSLYQVCTMDCVTADDCPVPDHPGVTVGCVMLNGQHCALSCDPEQGCPCGLVCTMVTPRTHICLEEMP